MNAKYLTLAGGLMFAALAATLFAANVPPPAVPANPFGPKPDASATAPAPAPPVATPPNPTPAPADRETENNFVRSVRQMLLARFDQDHNGQLDATEIADARAVFASALGARPGGRVGGGAGGAGGPLFGLRGLILANFGKTPGETLNADELARLHDFLFGKKETANNPGALTADQLREEIIRQFDKNGDGKLDPAELAAAQAFLQQVSGSLNKPNAAAPAPAQKNAEASPTPAK